jgi:hypothetical protein
MSLIDVIAFIFLDIPAGVSEVDAEPAEEEAVKRVGKGEELRPWYEAGRRQVCQICEQQLPRGEDLASHLQEHHQMSLAGYRWAQETKN